MAKRAPPPPGQLIDALQDRLPDAPKPSARAERMQRDYERGDRPDPPAAPKPGPPERVTLYRSLDGLLHDATPLGPHVSSVRQAVTYIRYDVHERVVDDLSDLRDAYTANIGTMAAALRKAVELTEDNARLRADVRAVDEDRARLVDEAIALRAQLAESQATEARLRAEVAWRIESQDRDTKAWVDFRAEHEALRAQLAADALMRERDQLRLDVARLEGEVERATQALQAAADGDTYARQFARDVLRELAGFAEPPKPAECDASHYTLTDPTDCPVHGRKPDPTP